MYTEKTITCKDCKKEFVFTSGEQEFFASLGHQDPVRCKDCRASRRKDRPDDRPKADLFDAICSSCGNDCKVPFQPSGDRPVYCRDCYKK